MASDIYDYECVVDGRRIHFSACDMKEAYDEYCFYDSDVEGSASQIQPAEALVMIERIRRGEIDITYLGGWCSSGITWGPDNIRHYCREGGYDDQ